MKKIFAFLIFLSILIRLINIGQPFLEGGVTRQIYNAMVAKHFYQEGLNILYPKIPIKGNEPFYQALELQLTPFIAAIFYRLTGGVNTTIFRLISVVFTVLAIYMLYKMLAVFFDRESALVSCFIFSFSPISIYLGRSANFEMPIIFFNIATIFYFYRWVKTERLFYALLANLAFIFAVSLKLPNLYLLLPLGFIAFSKWKWSAFSKNWMMAISLLIIGAWQGWEHHLRVIAPDKNWLHFSLAYNLQSIRECFTSLEFYKKTYNDALNYVLTPLGLIFAFIGLLLKRQNETEKILYFWLLGVLTFVVIMPEGWWAHGYYHMHYLPIAAFFVAKGFLFTIKRDYTKFYFSNLKVLIAIFSLLFILLSARYAIPFYKESENKKYVLKTAQLVRERIKPDELIISCVDSPGVLLYYADRKGWPMEFSYRGNEAIPILEDLRLRGASYFVCAYKKELNENKEFLRYITTRYKVAFENDFCLIVDLRN